MGCDLVLCSTEELCEVPLNQTELVVRLHKRTDPLGQLVDGVTIGKPVWDHIDP